MERDYSDVYKTLMEFFIDSFAEDAILVSEWLAQGGQDADSFYETVLDMKRQVNSYSQG